MTRMSVCMYACDVQCMHACTSQCMHACMHGCMHVSLNAGTVCHYPGYPHLLTHLLLKGIEPTLILLREKWAQTPLNLVLEPPNLHRNGDGSGEDPAHLPCQAVEPTSGKVPRGPNSDVDLSVKGILTHETYGWECFTAYMSLRLVRRRCADLAGCQHIRALRHQQMS